MKSYNYYVYMVTNPANTVLYTGVTNDLDRRMEEHYADCMGEKKTFARRYFCYNLVYYEYYSHNKLAILREKQLKGFTRKKKEDLIRFFNPEWRFFNSKTEQEKGNLPIWTLQMEDERPW